MPIPSALLTTVPLLLALGATPIQPPLVCTSDEVQNRWLQGCMYKVAEAQREAKGPADGNSSLKVFMAERDLAGSFVRLCEEKAREGVAKDGWWPPVVDDCPAETRVRWLDACVRDARAIVPGSRRRAVLEHFHPEGGLTSVGHTGFVHLRCSILKLDITFRLGGGPAESPDDVAQSVDTYIGFTAFD